MLPYSTTTLLPNGPVIVGYTGSLSSASLQTCVSNLTQSLKDGVNVMIWSFINMDGPFPNNKPVFNTNINPQCVQQVKKYAQEKKLNTVHIVSVGGWNAKHPSTIFSAAQWWDYFQEWNHKNNLYFDGIDWDVEGVNDRKSSNNYFTKKLLDLMGEMSRMANHSGNLVSMAPPESYLDQTTSLFDLSLLHTYPDWVTEGIEFAYHAHNTYAYLLAVYGNYINLVMPQLYETYSHCAYALHIKKEDPAKYLEDYISGLAKGYTVDFSQSSDPEIAALGEKKIVVPFPKLVVGLANGWADNNKGTLFIPTSYIQTAYQNLAKEKHEPKGFMFWDIGHEGSSFDNVPVFLAKELNKFLHIR